MTATISTLSALLKEFYLAPIQEQLNQEVLVLELMEKAVVDWAGRRVVIPLHTARNSGVGFRGDSDKLPDAGSEEYKRAEVDAKFLYGHFLITGPAISSLAKGGTASFASYVQAEMDKLVEDVRTKANRAAFTGGPVVGFINQYGTIASGSAIDFTGDTQKVKDLITEAAGVGAFVKVGLTTTFNGNFGADAGGYAPFSTGAENGITAANVSLGKIALGSDLDTTHWGTGSVTLPQGWCGTVTLLGAFSGSTDKTTAADTPLMYAALHAETQGIFGNLASTSHFSIPRQWTSLEDQTPIVRSNVFAASASGSQDRSPLTLPKIQETFDNVMQASGQEPDYMIMNPTQRQRYVALLQGVVNGGGNAVFFSEAGKGKKIADGGFVGLSYGNVPIKVSKDCPRGCVVFLKLDTWKLCELEKGDFADLDGAVISRVPGYDNYEGYYRHYYNTVCVRPNANAVLAGLSL